MKPPPLPRTRDRWLPVALACACPGLGQWMQKRYLPALLSFALVAAAMWKAIQVTLALLAVQYAAFLDPDRYPPVAWRQFAAAFGWLLLTVALHAFTIWDVWRHEKQR